jgi:hypothetical protein
MPAEWGDIKRFTTVTVNVRTPIPISFFLNLAVIVPKYLPPNSMVADSLGEHLYTGDITAIIGYRSFDNWGSLRMLPQSPFDGVSGAYGFTLIFLTASLYAANNTSNTTSGFQVDRTSGDLQPLTDSPYLVGTNPTSITFVNNFQDSMKPAVKCHDLLDRMKPYAGSQSHDELYRQDHCGGDPSPAAFDFGHLEFTAGDAGAIK